MKKINSNLVSTALTLCIISFLGMVVINPLLCGCSSGQSSSGSQYSASIENIDVEHNVKNDKGVYGMLIKTNASIQNMKGEIVNVYIGFYDKDGKPLKYKGNNDKYKNSDGYMVITDKFTLEGGSADVDMSFFVPYDEFHSSSVGSENYYFVMSLWSDNGGGDYTVLAESDTFAFHVTFE